MKIKIFVNVLMLFVVMVLSLLGSIFLQHNLASNYLYACGGVIFLAGVSQLTKYNKGTDTSVSPYMLATLLFFNIMFVAIVFFNLGRLAMDL